MNKDLLRKAGKMIVAGFEGLEAGDQARFCAEELCIGNWILFARNVASAEQVLNLNQHMRRMTLAHNGFEPFITIDQEGGIVSRLHGDMNHYPGAMACAAAGSGQAGLTAGIMGRHLNRMGINMNLAPVADINSNPLNPIVGPRSYGDTAESVTKSVLEVCKATLDAGIIPVIKHFPGHGDTAVDSHHDLPLLPFSRKDLEEREMMPFLEAIHNDLPAIMVAHMQIPSLDDSGVPSSLSEKVIARLLRRSMGFDGLVLTDCLEMKGIQSYYKTEDAVRRAVSAGVDLIYISHTAEEQENGVKAIYDDLISRRIPESRIDTSIARMEKYRKIHCREAEDKTPLSSGWSSEDMDSLRKTSRRSLTVLKDNGFLESGILPDSPRLLILHLRRPEQFIGENTVSGGEPVGILKKAFPSAAYRKLKPEEIERELREKPVIPGEWDRILLICSDLFRYDEAMAFVRKLIESGTSCAVAVMRTPYESADFREADALYLTYEDTVAAYTSLKEFFKGDFQPSGVCPVTIPGLN